jgi:two-component system, OmpR family, sensor histidine kinase MtrB
VPDVRRERLPRRGEQEKRRRHRRRFRLTGLRIRLMAAFAMVALLTAFAVTGVSYVLTRQSMMQRITTTSLQQFNADLQTHSDDLAKASAVTKDLSNIGRQMALGGNQVVLNQNGNEAPSGTITLEDVPKDLRQRAQTSAVWQRTRINGSPYLVMGITVHPSGTEVYEFVDLSSTESDLARLAQNSAYAAAIAFVISVLVALTAARRLLKPIRRLGLAARRLGSGKLDTRLEVRGNDEVADVSRTFNDTAEALERSVAELRNLEASSRRFVADVSHELRTPLTAMTAVTDMLEESTDIGDESAPAAQLIVNETRRLARLVEDLMEVSRFDAGTAHVRVEDVDLVELVGNCLDARGWTGRVKLTVPESMPVRVDRRRIDVVVANMVGNAIKHGGENAAAPVELAIGIRGADLILEVRDHGPGIPPDALNHIFDRFFKADKARGRSEGSGLGLSIAYENAHVHNGELTGRNHPGGGAVFTLRLPFQPIPEQRGGDAS